MKRSHQNTKRIFIDKDLNQIDRLEDESYNYIKNVLRLKVGDNLYILNRQKIGEFKIENVKKGAVILNKINERELLGANYNLHLYQACLKREYMDEIVEKSGELGVTRFTPIYTKRSQRDLNKKTLSRYEKLLIKGALQSEIEHIPSLSEPTEIKFIDNDNNQKFLFYEGCTEKSLPKVKSNNISLFIGPEGGLTDDEADALKDKGFQIISPTYNILKADTAAIVFIGIMKILMDLS
ncbi:MAG: RsmE family RNA methyltransferase [Deferribacterota bacterium]|nr:RsmE family RNA methyltransferase [Deferribacterota bacterium]